MSSRGNNAEATYESQNDQRLEELHAKIQTFRRVTTDIHDDVERQNLMLDGSNDHFASFGASLSQTSQRAKRVFTGEGGLKTTRVAMLVVAAFFAFWTLSKVYSWWFGS